MRDAPTEERYTLADAIVNEASSLPHPRRPWILYGFMAGMLALEVGCATSSGRAQGGTIGQSERGPAPVSLELETVTGDTISLESLRGRAVLVIAFTHDDLRSHATLREAERVARAHRESLAVIALCGNQGSSRTLRTLLQTFASVLELERVTVTLASDSIREGTSPLGVIESVPTTILINRAGYVSRTVLGLLDQRAIEALVAPALPPGG
jgi:hypothetical protein